MRFTLRNILFLTLAVLSLFSCGSKKKFVYVQGIENAASYEESKHYELTLQPDDVLSIVVSAEDPEVAAPFNIPEIKSNDKDTPGIKTYLIDNSGYIDYPILGKLKLAGLSRSEASNLLVSGLSKYIHDPSINLRIMNFKIAVLGEVANPNVFPVQHERITLLEALSMAGDIGVYGLRQNILIIRESEGKKTYTRIDITKPDFLNSPYYYLAQNDVVYVEPNKVRINTSAVGPNTAIFLSAASLLATFIVLLR